MTRTHLVIMNDVQNLPNQNSWHSKRWGMKYKIGFRETPAFDVQEFLELAVDSSQQIFLAPERRDLNARGESAVTFVMPIRAVIHASTIKHPNVLLNVWPHVSTSAPRALSKYWPSYPHRGYTVLYTSVSTSLFAYPISRHLMSRHAALTILI